VASSICVSFSAIVDRFLSQSKDAHRASATSLEVVAVWLREVSERGSLASMFVNIISKKISDFEGLGAHFHECKQVHFFL
jgi:hypothetical protein